MAEGHLNKTVGEILREARIAKNISFEAASKDTKIHVNILKNMESDDFKSLGTLYAKSFLKLYTEYLGLDKQEIIRRLEAQSGAHAAGVPKPAKIVKEERPAQKPVPIQKPIAIPKVYLAKKPTLTPKLVIVAVVLILFVFGIAKYIINRKAHPPLVKKTEAPKAAVVKKPAQPVIPKIVTVKKPAEKTIPGTAVSKDAEKLILVIRSKDKTYLQVKRDGKIVSQGMFAKGLAEKWEAKEKIELWIGDAGSVQLELNGRLLEKIGRPGQTLKRVVLTRAGLTIDR
jgi:cytoskeletal protein RodZ